MSEIICKNDHARDSKIYDTRYNFQAFANISENFWKNLQPYWRCNDIVHK